MKDSLAYNTHANQSILSTGQASPTDLQELTDSEVLAFNFFSFLGFNPEAYID